MNKSDGISELTARIAAEAPQHGGLPFWSWNDRLEDGELRRQIRHMKQLGMKGFFMHARGGLETEYLSDDWFHAVRICAEEAEKLGMEAWAYDENGWPSGFAGGELLKDPANQACGLVCERLPEFPAPDDSVLGVYVVTPDGGRKRVTAPCGADCYLAVRRIRDFSYVDTMNPEVTRRFLALTHDRYRKELSADLLGTVMPGFFTDEPQYYRYGTPWSDCFLTTFEQRFGYPVTDLLPALFEDFLGAEEFRYDYHLHCHESFYNGFMKEVYGWCERNHLKLTGHGIEEWGLCGQMMCCGGVMPFYLYEHIPGIDYLGRGVKDISGAKQLGSVCAQAGKRFALSEMFAACGWDVTPCELKQIADLQFAGGVNLICAHLYPYSERGQRKRDFPNHYSEHNPWSEYYGAFERHYQNLGAALSQGEECADTLVIHPIRSAYPHYRHTVHNVGIGIVCNEESGIAGLERAYGEFVRLFSELQIPYHFGDETVMKRLESRVEGNRLRVGKCIYRQVVLPYCECLDSHTVALLREFAANGGELLVLGDTPTRANGRKCDLSFLKSNITLSELQKQSGVSVLQDGGHIPLHMQMRRTDAGRLIFLANPSEQVRRNVEITVADCSGLEEIDIDSLNRRPLRGRKNPDGSVTVTVDFGASDSCLMAESDRPMLRFKPSEPKPFIMPDPIFRWNRLPENQLTLDTAQVSFDGGRSFSEPRPIVRIRDELLRDRFAGLVTLRYHFTAEELPERLLLVAEPMEEMRVSVNGLACSASEHLMRFDRRFPVFDLTGLTRIGDNAVDIAFSYFQREEVYRVLYGGGNEALRNSLSFDTEVESVYLYGDFAVYSQTGFTEVRRGILQTDGGFVLRRQNREINLSDLVRNGYPFFAGELSTVTTLYHQAGQPTVLKPNGRFAVCGAVINGTDLGMRLFSDEFELSPYLREGENELELRLCCSNRNLLGPHHSMDPEPLFVTPRAFSFEKEWNGGICEKYRPSYSFVRFGIGFSYSD